CSLSSRIGLRGGSDSTRAGPKTGPSCVNAPWLLGELEVRPIERPVVELDDELPTGLRPVVLVRLPDVGVGVCRGAVAETAATCVHGLLDPVDGRVGVTRDVLRLGVSGLEDVQALVAAETELDRNGRARLQLVQDEITV